MAQSAHSSKAPELSPSAVILYNNHGTNPHPGPQDVELRFAVKSAALLVGFLIELWLLVLFLDSFIMILTSVVILWMACDGHASLCEDNLAPSSPDISPHISHKVKIWLEEVRPSSPVVVEKSVVAQCDMISPLVFEIEENVLQEIEHKHNYPGASEETSDIEDIFAELCNLTAVFEVAEDDFEVSTSKVEAAALTDEHSATQADEVFLDLCGMFDISGDIEDRLHKQSSLDDGANTSCKHTPTQAVVEQEPSNSPGSNKDSVSEVFEQISPITEKPEQVSLGNEESPVKHDSGSVAVSLHVPIFNAQTLAIIMKQHESPSFNDGNIAVAWLKKKSLNYAGEIMYDHNAEVSSNMNSDECGYIGRSIMGDAKDINFILDILEGQIPVSFRTQLAEMPLAVRYKLRDRITNHNWSAGGLCYHWYVFHGLSRPINNWSDVDAAELARIRRCRSPCPDNERHLHGPDSHYRPFLTDRETEGINTESDDFVADNLTVTWLYGMEEHQLLDPNGFDSCECGQKAVGFVLAYRSELEHGYDPTEAYYSHFPLTFIAHEELAKPMGAEAP